MYGTIARTRVKSENRDKLRTVVAKQLASRIAPRTTRTRTIPPSTSATWSTGR